MHPITLTWVIIRTGSSSVRLYSIWSIFNVILRLKGIVVKKLIICVILLCSSIAQAQIICKAKLADVLLWNNGWVGIFLEGQTGPWLTCDLDTPTADRSIDQCKASYSMYLSALAMGTELSVYVANPDYTSCSDVPVWDTEASSDIKLVWINKPTVQENPPPESDPQEH